MQHFAHQAFFLVQRIDQYTVAFFPACYTRANFDNFAGDIQADNHRHRHFDAGHAAYGEHVVIVERGCADANHHVAFYDDRIGEICYVLQLFQTAVFVQDDCFHCVAPGNFAQTHQGDACVSQGRSLSGLLQTDSILLCDHRG